MTVPFTKGDPALIAKAKGEAIEFYGMAGRGATAPGAVVLRKSNSEYHPYVVHFANTQCGGYHGGNYCETLEEGLSAYAERCRKYDRDGDLHRAYIRQEAE